MSTKGSLGVLRIGRLLLAVLFFLVQLHVWESSGPGAVSRHLLERPKIYTYYVDEAELETSDNKSDTEDQTYSELIGLWTKHWYAAGWKPTVLTIEDAKNHPLYKVINKLTSENHPTVMEWLAMAQAGGGWLARPTVFALHGDFSNENPDNDNLTFWESNAVSLVSGSSEEFTKGALQIAHFLSQATGDKSELRAAMGLAVNRREGESFFNHNTVHRVNLTMFEKTSNGVGGRYDDGSGLSTQLALKNCFNDQYAVSFVGASDTKLRDIKRWLKIWKESGCQIQQAYGSTRGATGSVSKTNKGGSSTKPSGKTSLKAPDKKDDYAVEADEETDDDQDRDQDQPTGEHIPITEKNYRAAKLMAIWNDQAFDERKIIHHLIKAIEDIEHRFL